MWLPCCPSCSRHVKAGEADCPFCTTPLAAFVRAGGLATVPLALVACQATATLPAGLGSPGPVASSVPSAAPSPSPAATPSPVTSPRPASPTPTPLMTPSTWAPAPAPAYGKSTIVSGTVYDEAGATVDGAVVKVNSLDSSVPYQASITTSQGSWVVNNVPEGANIEVIATKDGWTSRRRVGSFQTQANVKNIVDFGGQANPYFLSDYPEIAAVAPGDDATGVEDAAVSYQLTLSEPLDTANQKRFADAVRLFPANSLAAPENDGSNGGAGFTDLKGQAAGDRPVDPGQGYQPAALPNHPVAGWDYSIKNGTRFLDDANTIASVTWDATGTVATLGFNAPLIADHAREARYQVGLVAPGERIVDKDNHQLGVDVAGSRVTYPPAGSLLHATVKQADLALDQLDTSAEQRWIATHQDAARFAVKVDAEQPRLLSAAYTANVGASSRFELTFTKPLAAYNGRAGGHVGDGIRTASVLDALSLVVSDHVGGTADVPLKGGQVGLTLDPNAGPFAQLGQAFMLRGGASAAEPYGEDIQAAAVDGTKAGRYLLAVNPANARTLFIYVVGRADVFDPRVVELKVRAPGVSDQAGNLADPASTALGFRTGGS